MNAINQQLDLFPKQIKTPYLYLLTLDLDEKIKRQIAKIKTDFGKEFKSNHALNSIPHLTLSQFVSTLDFEEKIVKELDEVSKRSNTFKVILNNFSGFQFHTIYINVENKPDILELLKQIKVNVKIPIKTEYGIAGFSDNPHVTIARKLNKIQYNRWSEKYSQSNFHADFIAKKMILLRKPLDNSESYRIVKEFDLKDVNHG